MINENEISLKYESGPESIITADLNWRSVDVRPKHLSDVLVWGEGHNVSPAVYHEDLGWFYIDDCGYDGREMVRANWVEMWLPFPAAPSKIRITRRIITYIASTGVISRTLWEPGDSKADIKRQYASIWKRIQASGEEAGLIVPADFDMFFDWFSRKYEGCPFPKVQEAHFGAFHVDKEVEFLNGRSGIQDR